MSTGDSINKFIDGVRQLEPDAVVVCDAPDVPTSSTWLDIRTGGKLFVVEWNPQLGFGFPTSDDFDDTSLGAPSGYFIFEVNEAVSRFDRILSNKKMRRRNLTGRMQTQSHIRFEVIYKSATLVRTIAYGFFSKLFH